MDEMRAGYINSDENYGDLLMIENLPTGERGENLLREVYVPIWDI
jgi:hypothetical protein